jgi:hypothetical protein
VASDRCGTPPGGALWKFYLKLNGETPEITATRLWGVPFYQTKAANGSHTLTCHGMGGVYGALLEARRLPS